MVERLFELAGRKTRIVSLPAGLLAKVVAQAARTPWLQGANAEMVRRQCLDLVFDDSVVRARLGIQPRPFAPVAADFRMPDADTLRSLHRHGQA
jgi:hypothetical protein